MSQAINIPELTTQRLELKPLDCCHSQGMFALWSSDAVCRYSGTVTDYQRNQLEMPATSSQTSDRIIDFWQRAAGDGWGFRWAVLLGSEFIGTVGFNSLKLCSEIAYHLVPTYWGCGYMREAAQAAIDWRTKGGLPEGINTKEDYSFEAFIEPNNQASIALALRLGFQPTEEVHEGARRYLLAADTRL